MKINTDQSSQLRETAEAHLAGLSSAPLVLSAEVLLHELQVHQIELEMQNENLLQTQLALAESRDRYHDLYEFAPVGYLTLDTLGLIEELNQTAAAMLGTERKLLLGRPLAGGVDDADKERWHRYFQDTIKRKTPSSCELMFLLPDDSTVFFRLDGRCITEENAVRSVRITLTDMTSGRRAEAEIVRSRKLLDADRLLFHAILDNAPIGIWMLGSDNRIKFINNTFCNAVGISEQQFVSANHYADVLPTSVSGNCIKSDRSCLEQETPHLSAEWVPFADGKLHFLEITKAKLRDYEGRTVGLIGLAADITERHHAETLLRESEEKFRAIFESTLDGVVLIDATGMIVDCNPEFERQAGRTIEQLKQMRIWELRPAEKVHLAREEFLKVMETGSGGAVSLKFKKPDGNVIHIEIRGRTLCIGGKRYIQSITHDITERRRMEEIQRIGALRYKLLFESSRDALMTLAPPLWKFTGANGATLKLFGISDMAEFTACGPAKLSPLRQSDGGLSEEAMQKMIGIALRCGSHFFEWEHQRMDGKPFSASVLLTRMALGDELFLLSTVRDITEHKSREREIRESQALLRELAVQGAATREAELKHMAREVHDELGQLLTALRMDISLLRIQFGGRDPQLMDKIQGMLSLVDKAIGGVRNVAANLRPPALDMGVVPAILWLGDEFTDRTKIKCKVHVLDGTVELGDQSTLTLFRIVQESLTNVARHALANMVEIRIELRDDAICVEVRDDGQGFDMSVIPAKNSFGLMGMNERALAVGGKVEISSLPLQGTVVSVCIPLS